MKDTSRSPERYLSFYSRILRILRILRDLLILRDWRDQPESAGICRNLSSAPVLGGHPADGGGGRIKPGIKIGVKRKFIGFIGDSSG